MGELKDDISSRVKELGLFNRVIFTEVRSDVPDLLQAIDALLFPSYYDGILGVVLEAQATGLPCIISDRITDEVKITELVEYISLSKDANYWSQRVFNRLASNCRDTADIVKAGYDIETVSK